MESNGSKSQDFECADRGLLRSLEPCNITSANGNKVWSSSDYSFLAASCPNTANPSLWRQSQLLNKQGLYEVTKGIYQVRGFDLSNMTIVQCANGVIVIDPLVSQECARAAMQLYREEFPRMSSMVKAVIYTHSHIDHYGGAEGVLPPVAERKDIRIIAPNGFMEHAVSENVYAGNAMNRRAAYMYGDQIPKGPKHQIGTGLGMTSSCGTSSIVKPTEIITDNRTENIDGVTIKFQLTPNTEAPSEMNFHFPDFKALCMAENATHTMHNIQTLRGAMVRDAHLWSKYLDEAMELFMDETDVLFASHHWPTWGRDEIRMFMTCQRDMYAYLNDQTLRMLNEGQTGLEIAEHFKLPSSLSDKWYNQEYYGSISHNVKAIYNRYMGWFDANPAHLWEHPPVEMGKFYLECMGGVGKVIKLAKGYQDRGNLRFAATLLNHAVFGSTPTNPEAMAAMADVLERLGYDSTCGPWRNFYLVGAYELRNGIQAPAMREANAETLMALDLDQLMDTMAVRLDGPNTPATHRFSIDFMVKDMPKGTNGRVLLTLSNCALTNHPVTTRREEANLTCKLTHMELVNLVMGKMQIDSVNTTGDKGVWNMLTSCLTMPNPAFAIVTPEMV